MGGGDVGAANLPRCAAETVEETGALWARSGLGVEGGGESGGAANLPLRCVLDAGAGGGVVWDVEGGV